MLIYEALKNDHDKVKDLLNELMEIPDGISRRRHELIEKIRDELVPHSRAEESVFYNSLRSIDAAKDLVMHGYSEHMEIEAFLRTLQAKDKVDADWRKTAAKLKASLEHHIDEEEGRIFNVAQQLFTEGEAEMMAEAFEQLKPEVREGGIVRSTLDLIANIMPERFAAPLRTLTFHPRV